MIVPYKKKKSNEKVFVLAFSTFTRKQMAGKFLEMTHANIHVHDIFLEMTHANIHVHDIQYCSEITTQGTHPYP